MYVYLTCYVKSKCNLPSCLSLTHSYKIYISNLCGFCVHSPRMCSWKYYGLGGFRRRKLFSSCLCFVDIVHIFHPKSNLTIHNPNLSIEKHDYIQAVLYTISILFALVFHGLPLDNSGTDITGIDESFIIRVLEK